MRSATDQRAIRYFAAAALVAVAAGTWLPAPAPAAVPVDMPDAVTVDGAIRRGLEFVFSQQDPDGRITTRHADTHAGAVEALAVMAALNAGASTRQQNIAAAIDYVRRTHPETVSARAMRIIMLARVGVQDDLKAIEQDVAWLVRNRRMGGWGFGPGHPAALYRPGRTDTVNSHLALLALAEADQAGLAVPDSVWKQCREYWARARNTDGGWGYEPRSDPTGRVLQDSFAPTTAAGAVAMFLLERKRLQLDQTPGTGGQPAGTAPDRTVLDPPGNWLTAHYDLQSIPGAPLGKSDGWYYPYLLSFIRAAECTGKRAIGTDQDRWLPRAAVALLNAQSPADGHWPASDGTVKTNLPRDQRDGHDIVRTCLATLALARCRSGVLINKLSLGKAAKNDPLSDPDPFDAQNLARWYERKCGPTVGWRTIGPTDPHDEFAQGTILYINVRDEFAVPDAFADRAKYYVRNGGTILVHVHGSNHLLATKTAEYFLKLLPDYHVARVPFKHPVYSIRFAIPSEKQPNMTGIGDYCRIRVFLVSGDLGTTWHTNRTGTHPEAFQLVANIAQYGTNGRPPRGKFDRRQARPPKPAKLIPIARVFHSGDYNTNPLALARLSDVLSDALSIGVDVKPAVKLGEAPSPRDVTMLWLTGTRPARLDVGPCGKLKAYIQAGGTLLVDPAMGGEKFFDDAKAMLQDMFGAKLKRARADSDILTGNFAGGLGANVTNVAYTTSPGIDPPKRAMPEIWQVELDGRIAVVLSRHGLVCPVEGLPTYGCKGLARDDARRLVANVALYAASKR